jgi:uncharacterized membrane protein YdbT with pleckstrin-like domain
MALQNCRECGHRVSTEARTCPQCGVPDPTRVVVPSSGVGGEEVGASYASRESMTREEDAIYRAHVHWSVYSSAIVAVLLAVASWFVYEPLAIGLGAAAAVLGIVAYVKSTSTEFVITTRRLIAKRGIVSRKTIETLLEKVEAVSVDQSLMGRIMDYGTVTVQGTGGTRESFAMVSNPLDLRKVIHEQIDLQRSITSGR